MDAEPPKTNQPKRKCRWFQFRLRTLLIFAMVVAIPCAWAGRRIEIKRRERAAIAAFEPAAFVGWDYLHNVDSADPPGPAWIRSILGDDFFAEVDELWFDQGVGDKVLENLKEFHHLKRLGLVGAKITNDTLRDIQTLSELEELDLSLTSVTDARLEHLDVITGLRELSLRFTAVSDVGLASLTRLSSLKFLDLSYTKVTQAGIKSLQAALPNCEINIAR